MTEQEMNKLDMPFNLHVPLTYEELSGMLKRYKHNPAVCRVIESAMVRRLDAHRL